MVDLKNTNKDIHVVHVIWSASFGGIEKVVMDLCYCQLNNPGVTPTLLIGKKEGAFQNQLKESDIPYIYAGFKTGRDLNLKLFKKLKSIFNNCDIIHIHTFNPLIAFAARCSKKPIVYTIHGNFGFGRKLNKFQKFNKYLLKLFLTNSVDHITCNSKFTFNTAIKHYGINNNNSTVVFNGVPTDHISQESSRANNIEIDELKNKFVIGTSSRFAEVKRIDKLIEAYSHVVTKIPDSVLLLVGDGVLRRELEDQVKDLNLTKHVIFVGYQEKVTAYQQAMDVCVFPSGNEAFGLVAIETLLLGKPTIVFNDGGGMKEILEESYPGDIVNDITELSQRILYYHQNPISEKERSDRTKFGSGFDINIMAQKIKNLYIKLLPGS